MSPENGLSGWFELRPLKLQKLETALTEPRYMVILIGQGKRFMIAPKLADVIVQLQQRKSPEQAARDLSVLWQQEVAPEALCQIIELQMLPQGIVCPVGQAPAISDLDQLKAKKRKPLLERLVIGKFRWQLMPRKVVSTICSPLTVFYEPLSVLLAVLLIVATRWLLYASIDGRFIRQLVLDFTPNEYLMSLALLIVVVLIHEFGHATGQLRFGLPAGKIGFQLFHYIPAFFTNVDASWRLTPGHRMVVDIGGVYFQSIAGSLLFLVYLKTHFLPILTTVLASDILSLVALNPFLRFDGYWLMTDALAVPNLSSLSKKLWAQWRRRVWGRKVAAADIPPLSRTRTIAVLTYGLVKNSFWGLLIVGLILKMESIVASVGTVIFKLLILGRDGLKTGDLSLILASFIRLTLFMLMVLALSTIVARLLLGFAKWSWRGLGRIWRRRPEQTFPQPS